MKFFLFFLFFIPFISNAQKGMEFVHGKTWKEVIEKAKAENKYIFVDAYATWCGPCKYMAAKVFTQDKVGEAYNSSFVNVKVQMDTTAKDNEEVVRWYEESHKMATAYNVRVYPTYLIFNSEGRLVHRFVGSMEADEFCQVAKKMMDKSNQYYPMLEVYKGGSNKESEFLLKLAYTADAAYDMENVKAISKDYLATQKNYETAENIKFIKHFTQSSNDAGFKVLMENESKINEAGNNPDATNKILEIINQEELYPVFKKKSAAPNWKLLTASITKKYPLHAAEVIAEGKVSYYHSKNDWNNYQVAVQQYMRQYGQKATPARLNEFAWTVFENCKDMACIKEALEWSKRSLQDKEDPAYIDTYANLLYKTGKKEEAIRMEEKALSMVGEEEKQDYKMAIEKMQRGQKTWKE